MQITRKFSKFWIVFYIWKSTNVSTTKCIRLNLRNGILFESYYKFVKKYPMEATKKSCTISSFEFIFNNIQSNFLHCKWSFKHRFFVDFNILFIDNLSINNISQMTNT